jgi:hypothetical protein
MATIEVKLLFSIEMGIEGHTEPIGATPQGVRAIGNVSGRFEGLGIKGTITACDWFISRPDGIGEADVRGTLRTDDGALIYMRYNGLLDMRHSGTAAGAATPSTGTIQVRTAVRFETGAERYRELNCVQAIGIGEVSFDTGRIKYNIYAF